MAGESQLQPTSIPDPSVLSTDAVARAVTAERDYVDGQIAALKERLNGIDRATEVLNQTVTRTPTEIQVQVAHVRELLISMIAVTEARINSAFELGQQRREAVDKHFEHLDKVRGEDKREARALVDLALAAQKEASSVALINANTAIDKAAVATDKRYDSLDKAVQDMRVMLAAMMPRKESEARHSAHEVAVSMLSSRVTAIEATKVGGKEQMAATYAVAAFVVSLVVVFGILAATGVFSK
jgi:hypothetical protein